jgi:PIN domain nuclease of toxin-antitoxin system
MKLLLDSHTALWSIALPEKLGDEAQKLLNDRGNEFWISKASIIEITIKINLRKLTYGGGVREFLADIDFAKFQIMEIERNHLLEYEKLPLHHRDPFDRLIISQALSEKISVISKDGAFKLYGIDVIW